MTTQVHKVWVFQFGDDGVQGVYATLEAAIREQNLTAYLKGGTPALETDEDGDRYVSNFEPWGYGLSEWKVQA